MMNQESGINKHGKAKTASLAFFLAFDPPLNKSIVFVDKSQ